MVQSKISFAESTFGSVQGVESEYISTFLQIISEDANMGITASKLHALYKGKPSTKKQNVLARRYFLKKLGTEIVFNFLKSTSQYRENGNIQDVEQIKTVRTSMYQILAALVECGKYRLVVADSLVQCGVCKDIVDDIQHNMRYLTDDKVI